MIYKIGKNYYILVGNDYVRVEFIIENNNVELKGINEDRIERSIKINAIPFDFNDKFKQSIINKNKKPSTKPVEKKEDVFVSKRRRKR